MPLKWRLLNGKHKEVLKAFHKDYQRLNISSLEYSAVIKVVGKYIFRWEIDLFLS